MSNWSCSQQVCASCRYWCGRRNIDFTACFFEALAERGSCAGPDGSFRGLETNEGSACSQWETFRK